MNALAVLGEQLIASGDDDGYLKLWDIRMNPTEAVATFQESEESVSGVC